VFVDDHPVARAPFSEPVRIGAGKRRIRAEAPGYAPFTRVIDIVGGETMTVELPLGAPLEALYREAPSDSSGPGAALYAGIATGVLGLGAGAMAIWTSRDQAEYEDALARRTSRRELDSLRDETETKALITDALLSATIVGAALTVVLLVVDDDATGESGPTTAAVEVGPGSLRARF
jgi:hypothetical protein